MFALRLDSQGEMNTAGFLELPEPIRIAGVAVISVGLPEPTAPPTDAPEVVDPTEFPSEEPMEDPSLAPTDDPAAEVTDEASPEPTP